MLPVVIYEAEETARGQILTFLRGFTETHGQRLSIVGNAASLDRAEACVEQEKGILLLIIGIAAGAGAGPVALERRAGTVNRDSYCLYWLHDMGDLPEVASQCLHPAGFILPPPEQARFEAILQRICADYDALTGSSDADFIALQCGGTTHRLPVSGIDYIEALDKKLNIWTKRQCLTVYEKLGHMEELLGAAFFRCHRSYLVNFSRIERVDYAAMELRLEGGARLPLSRSAKDRLKQRMQEEVPAK